MAYVNAPYENYVLENRIEDILTTTLDMNGYMTADYSLTEHAGMKKKVHKYLASGQVDEVGVGEGNTHAIGVTYDTLEYEVGTTQGKHTCPLVA